MNEISENIDSKEEMSKEDINNEFLNFFNSKYFIASYFGIKEKYYDMYIDELTDFYWKYEDHKVHIYNNLIEAKENRIKMYYDLAEDGKKIYKKQHFTGFRVMDSIEPHMNTFLIVSNDMKLIDEYEERKKVTKGLRFDVMKRDNFYCVLCGATAKNNKLVIDHIKPIAKNGRTVLDNLQTLCQNCNTGKSAKYEKSNNNIIELNEYTTS